MTGSVDGTGAGAGAVVVGVDESECARTALVTALREGERRGLAVVAVIAFDPPDLWALEAGGALFDPEELARDLRAVVEKRVEEVSAQLAGEGVEVPPTRIVVSSGSPADVLCRVATGAELLVVGHRGRGSFATRLIGSVGLGVVLHASCPVLVVRPTESAPA